MFWQLEGPNAHLVFEFLATKIHVFMYCLMTYIHIRSVKDLFNPKDPWSPYIINALKAKALFKKDVQYVTRGTEIMIVDEFTGRVLEVCL